MKSLRPINKSLYSSNLAERVLVLLAISKFVWTDEDIDL